MVGHSIRPEVSSLVQEIGKVDDPRMTVFDRIGVLLNQKIHALPILFKDLKASEFMAIAAALGSADAPAALSLSMHLYTLWGLVRRQGDTFSDVFTEIVSNNKLMGSLNEPGLYFMLPGKLDSGTYPVRAKRVDGGYRINGLKKFVSLEPFVSYLPVYCMVEGYTGSDLGVISVLLRKDADGVTVVRDWNSVAMNATHSNSIKLDNVFCSDSYVICGEEKPIASLAIQGYLFRFNVSCVYLGIARRAFALAVETAKTKRPPNCSNVLAKYPGIQFSTAEMMISLEIMEAQMRDFCCVVDAYLDGDQDAEKAINCKSLIAKEVIARESEALVSSAMKITGIHSLSNDNLLSSIFKDIKAAQFHPPQRDVAYELLAKEALGVISYKQRWL